MKSSFRVLLLLPLALAALPAHAQQTAQPSPLVVTAENRSAVVAEQRGTPRPDAKVLPGDILRYRLTFTNTSGRPVRGVSLSNPLAEEFRFQAGSARASREDAQVEYSIDGGQSFSPQPMEEAMVEGRRVRRAAAPEQYTHVRWTVVGWVAAGATVSAEFDARFAAAARGTDSAAGRTASHAGGQ